jgi:hypothetical protein
MLVERLLRHGLPACAISSSVGQDVERPVVYLRALKFDKKCVMLRFAERAMIVPFGALLVIVCGDVHVGRYPQWSSTSGMYGATRPIAAGSGFSTPSGSTGEYVRDSRESAGQDVFAAADIHFVTVPWVARIDGRELEFPTDYMDLPNVAERIDRCVGDLAMNAGIRVDRALRTSSLASYTAGSQRSVPPPQNGSLPVRRTTGPSDEHFDAYSRMVAEAERVVLNKRIVGTIRKE